jgi:hypothetical protein
LRLLLSSTWEVAEVGLKGGGTFLELEGLGAWTEGGRGCCIRLILMEPSDSTRTRHNPLSQTHNIGKLLSLTSLYRASLARMQLARQPLKATAVGSAEATLKRPLAQDMKVLQIQSEIKGRFKNSRPSSIIPKSASQFVRPLTSSFKGTQISYFGKDVVRSALGRRSSLEFPGSAMDIARSAMELRSSVVELPRGESQIKQCYKQLDFPRVLYRKKAQLECDKLLKQELSPSKPPTSQTDAYAKTHQNRSKLRRVSPIKNKDFPLASHISAPVSPKSTRKQRQLPKPIKLKCKGVQTSSTPRPWSQASSPSAVLNQQGI